MKKTMRGSTVVDLVAGCDLQMVNPGNPGANYSATTTPARWKRRKPAVQMRAQHVAERYQYELQRLRQLGQLHQHHVAG